MPSLLVGLFWLSLNRGLNGLFGIFISSSSTHMGNTVSTIPVDQCGRCMPQVIIQFHHKTCSLLLLVSIANSSLPHLVRRQAESFMGKVTCLPGCITMIAVRDEMAGAIKKYSEPVTKYPVVFHQVQYLVSSSNNSQPFNVSHADLQGTDRRLTYSMLSQDKKLHTLFVREAISETIAPQSLQHYLSQRRRWGSNAYFNNYFYTWGEKVRVFIRIL